MKIVWKNKGIFHQGKRCEINGLNIWDYKWNWTGQNITIKDPLYNKPYLFHVFEIIDGNLKAKFAAGEFSNSVYGIYVEKKSWF